MDKIKLFSKKRNNIPQHIIDNEFDYVGCQYDSLKHNTRRKFKNDRAALCVDKNGFHITTNPTSYLKGHNIYQINRHELQNFKEIFETDLHINTNDFTLTGFDYNINIETDYNVGSYLRSFHLLPKYKKEIYANGSGTTFINRCKTFSIYDKLEQVKKSKGTVPQDCINSNIMRLELGIKSRLNKTLNLAKIHTLQDLINADNYISMIKEFEHIYSKINKQPIYKFLNMTKPNPSIIDTDSFILIYYINEIGLDNYIDSLDQERRMEIISYKQMKTRKDKAIFVWNEYSKLDDNHFDLFKEMNDKVTSQIQSNIKLAL